MKYKFLEDIAIADIAYRAYGNNLIDLFTNAAEAVFEVMVDTVTVDKKDMWEIKLESSKVDNLLYDFLSDLIALKDEEAVVLGKFDVSIKKDKDKYRLNAKVYGDKIDPRKYELRTDVKAVTLHMFGVKKIGEGYRATVVLDV